MNKKGVKLLDNKQVIEKALMQFGNEATVTNSFITESTDHTTIVVLRNDARVLAVYQVLDNDELFRLNKFPPNIKDH